MLSTDTFLTTVYVAVDDFCKQAPARARHPGPAAALSPSEVVTLALTAQWGRFASERAFYRYAQHHLRPAFPRLPARSQFNRLVRQHQALLVAFGQALGRVLLAHDRATTAYQVLDTTAVPVRNVRRRGRHRGWLAGQSDIGWSTRLGWYEGVHLLTAVTPRGVLTGFGIGAASASDQALAETLLAGRAQPTARLASVGDYWDYYLTDSGFEGRQQAARWCTAYRAVVCAPPKTHQRGARAQHWPARRRRWWAGARQIVETVFEKLEHTFRLLVERPHALAGLQARLAAMVALHNCCIWLNRQLGRPDLAFADLIDW